MQQFIRGNDAQWNALVEAARGGCVRFCAQDMPPGSTPATADVGFEVDPANGASRIYVSRGVNYRGNRSVEEWLGNGTKEFGSIAALREWICGPLAGAWPSSPGRNSSADQSDPSSLTDLERINRSVRPIDGPVYLDEGELASALNRKVLGQEEATAGLASAAARHCARSKPRRPGVVFAVGPSGVGKTRAAECLASALRHMVGEETGYGFTRLDMSEYQEAHRVSQLTGAPQGYVGHNEGSQLVDAVSANPRQIVLFDEIEKAHPAVHRTLMNVMDAGRLSSPSRTSNGHEIDFRHAILLLTSNIDSEGILTEVEERRAFGNRPVVDEICRRRLRARGIPTEIVGRIGQFIVFRPLSQETRAAIIALAVVEVGEEYGVEVEYVHPDVVIELMNRVRTESFGVRPERFLIDEMLGGAFAQAARGRVPGPVRVMNNPVRCEAKTS